MVDEAMTVTFHEIYLSSFGPSLAGVIGDVMAAW